MDDSLKHIIVELKARQDIQDVLVRYCRGADLGDAAIMQSCYHDDAIDDHGFFNGPAAEFVKNAATNLTTMFESTRHYMTNEYVELNGNEAKSECFILCIMRMARDGKTFDVSVRSRYLDKFECRDGVWKIAHRTLVSDGTRIDEVVEQFPRLDQGAPGGRGKNDPSSAFFKT